MRANWLLDTASASARVGRFAGYDVDGYPLVYFGGNPDDCVKARVLGSCACELLAPETPVLLVFEEGDPNNPIIVGPVISGRRERSNTMLVESEACRIEVRSRTVSIEA